MGWPGAKNVFHVALSPKDEEIYSFTEASIDILLAKIDFWYLAAQL